MMRYGGIVGIKLTAWSQATVLTAWVVLASTNPVLGQTACVGDCNDDGEVMINELVIGVNIALEVATIAACPSFDVDDSAAVEINELVQGVNNSLNDCPPVGPSPTLPVVTPTPTDTTGPEPSRTTTPTAVTHTSGPTATPTATCAPTGTPFCADECVPCPTIRANCPSVACGACIAEEPCSEGSVRSDCGGALPCLCPCVTVTPGGPTPTPTQTQGGSSPSATAAGPATATRTSSATVGGTASATPAPSSTPTPSGTLPATSTPLDTPTEGAPPSPIVTPTRTETATATLSPSPTAKPNMELFAGSSIIAAKTVSIIPNLLGAVMHAMQTRGGVFGTAGEGIAAGINACSGGGTLDTAGTGLNRTWDFNDCVVPTAAGSIEMNGLVGMSIFVYSAQIGTLQATNLTVAFSDQQTTILTTTLNLTAIMDLTLAPAPGNPCLFDIVVPPNIPFLDLLVQEAELSDINGAVTAQTTDGATVSLTFQDASADLTVGAYSNSCFPTDYTVVLNGVGLATLTVPFGGAGNGSQLVDLRFDDYSVAATVDASGVTSMDVDGTVRSDCFSGTAELDTIELLTVPLGQICPSSGHLVLEEVGQLFYSNGMIGLDSTNDGIPDATYPSCTDAALFGACLG